VLSLSELFPFPLDDFQLDAIAALEQDKSVVVCAPTGSGKTLIGEYAIHRALAQGKRVFYTTPLKALSNQKLRDFREQFGSDTVGLLTGDTSVNRDAPILVMTTEIFRNMLYGTPIGEVGTSLIGVETVVLDECHYMNDRQRGTVWEEAIIYCPAKIQLVALSATVANSDQLTDWLAKVHGPTQLIYSTFRPVPLTFHYCNLKGMFPLLNDQNTAIHPRLKHHQRPPRSGQRGRRPQTPSIAAVVSHLQQRQMLPAIYFIFSRRGCDKAVNAVDHLSLVTPEEAAELKPRIDAFLAQNPDAGRVGQVEPLYRGIAAHHAGILPAWKGLVEELFQAGLIKVVFATETLAAGINMPARTTVISSLSKRTDRGHRLLNPSEFLQMAGRAGRRGMDDQGHVVTVETPFEGAKEAAHLATTGADPLVSQFTPSYGMVLNLLQTHSLPDTRALIERSFGQYLANLGLGPKQKEVEQLAMETDQVRQSLGDVDDQLLAEYEKLQGRLREEKRLLKILQQQAREVLSSDMALALSFAIAGTILSLKGKNVPVSEPVPAVLVTKVPGSGQFPYLVCITQDNRWYVVAVADVVGLHAEYPRIQSTDNLNPPVEMPLKPGQCRSGDETTARIAGQIPTPPSLVERAPEVQEQLATVEAVTEAIDTHPVRQLQSPKAILKRQRRLLRLETALQEELNHLDDLSHRHWQEFAALMDILTAFGCLEEGRPTRKGEIAATFRGENELWLGLALDSGQLDHLPPPQFAAACAALVTENSRPDTWVDLRLSGAVGDALDSLRELRRSIFQTQNQHNVMLPLWFDLELIAVVEHWALGVDWATLCEHTSLDEGDIVRLLRRTLDLLSQIPHVPHMDSGLARKARNAIDLMNRFPVNENLA
jgi:superfamily II RNA helicase